VSGNCKFELFYNSKWKMCLYPIHWSMHSDTAQQKIKRSSKVQKFKFNAYSRKQNEALWIMQTFEKSECNLIIPVLVTNKDYLWSTDQLKKKLRIFSDSCKIWVEENDLINMYIEEHRDINEGMIIRNFFAWLHC
jgi:hypothetical protein